MSEPGGAGPGPLDRGALAQLRRFGGDTLLRQVVELFTTQTPKRLAAAREAAGAGDGPTLERVAHSLRSSAGQLGAQPMAVLCGRIEQLAGTGRVAEAGPLLAELAEVYGRVLEDLDHFVPRGG